MIDQAHVLESLQSAGLRITAPRREVVEMVCQQDGPFSADDLYERLRAAGSSTGRATVFRTLDLLVGLHLLGRIHRPDGTHGYVLHEPGHRHHLVCSTCGAVVEFQGCNVEALVDELVDQTRFRIEGHWLEFFGVCVGCQEAAG